MQVVSTIYMIGQTLYSGKKKCHLLKYLSRMLMLIHTSIYKKELLEKENLKCSILHFVHQYYRRDHR